ncbi:MAG: hypothetical protein LC624_12695 [Halobacteriales archaeon]|nr:hypothetical protein [Halobacteriales archaeon]
MAGAHAYHKTPQRELPRSAVERYHPDDAVDEAQWFAQWATKSRFQLKQAFLGELDRRPLDRNAEKLKQRFVAACEHGRKVQTIQGVVTVLLAFTAVTAAVGGLAGSPVLAPFLAISVFNMAVAGFVGLIQFVGAVSTTFAILLLVARLATGRYLEMVEAMCDYTAMQLATLKCM